MAAADYCEHFQLKARKQSPSNLDQSLDNQGPPQAQYAPQQAQYAPQAGQYPQDRGFAPQQQQYGQQYGVRLFGRLNIKQRLMCPIASSRPIWIPSAATPSLRPALYATANAVRPATSYSPTAEAVEQWRVLHGFVRFLTVTVSLLTSASSATGLLAGLAACVFRIVRLQTD